MTTLAIIAKEPLPGKAKTRLHPPLSLEQAARLAAACIDDTLAAVATLTAERRILLWDGGRPPAAADGYEVVHQVPGELDTRLGALFDLCTGPTVLIGMDTPQLTAMDLMPAFRSWPAGTDAWLGPAADGGFWALGMYEPRGELVRGIAMSRADTGQRQRERLHLAGLHVATLPVLRDVDTFDDARTVAESAPETRFARLFRSYAATSGA